MNIEEVRGTTDQARSYNEWFENEWNRNGVKGLIRHNDQLIDNVKYLLSIIEQVKKDLGDIEHISSPRIIDYTINQLARKALNAIQGDE